MNPILLASLLLCTGAVAADTRPAITSCRALEDALGDATQVGRRFNIEGNILFYFRRPVTYEWIITVDDGSGNCQFFESNKPGSPATNLPHVALNDRVRMQGSLIDDNGQVFIAYKNAEFLGSHPLKEFSRPQEFFTAGQSQNLFRFRGLVRDIFRDESDPKFICLLLNCDGVILHAMMYLLSETPFDSRAYIGAEVAVAGSRSNARGCLRGHVGHILLVSGPENIQILRQPRDGDTPDISVLDFLPPNEIARRGLHQAAGTVIAAWHGDTALLRTDSGQIVKFTTNGDPLPSCGQKVLATGLPETDLYFVNLVHASWSAIANGNRTPTVPEEVSINELLTDSRGNQQIRIQAHGRPIRLSGIVRHLPQFRNQDARIQIESDGHLVPVDVSAHPASIDGLSIGCTVSVFGTCVIDIGNTNQSTSIPKARGLFVVTTSPDAISVLSRPPWWTAGRLMAVVGVLLAVIAGILFWNNSLRRLTARKGLELMREQLGHVKAELKTEERTRLAVELHDSLAQNLTGVSLEIDTAAKMADADVDAMKMHLGIAARSLKSCREELRNCLWDLRNRALEAKSMDEAIRQTLAPHVVGADVAVRFNVPRDHISDNSAHSIMRIIRELTLNAIRHGGATKIWIAGSIDAGRLLFSVRDNGSGFDPNTAPGFSAGHYGLLGIRERVDEFEGEFTLVSSPGKGTKATVSLKAPQEA